MIWSQSQVHRQKALLDGVLVKETKSDKIKSKKFVLSLNLTASRPKYDDLLSNPTTETQTVGHTRETSAYKAKVCPGGAGVCTQLNWLI